MALKAYVVITEWSRPHDLNGSYTLEGVALTQQAADSIAANARFGYQRMGLTLFGIGPGESDDSDWACDVHVEEREVDVLPRAAIAQARLDNEGAIAELRAELEQQRVLADHQRIRAIAAEETLDRLRDVLIVADQTKTSKICAELRAELKKQMDRADEAERRLCAIEAIRLGGGQPSHVAFSGEMVKLFAQSMAEWFDVCGGKNVVQSRVADPRNDREFEFTMQLVGAKTPLELREEALAELEQQRTRAEAAEFDLHAERLAHAETLARLPEASRG